MKTEAANRQGSSLGDWLQWGSRELAFLGEHEARGECEQILEALLRVSRTELYLSAESDPCTFPEFSEILKARKRRIPLAYLVGGVYFWDEWFHVEEGVFIPRPETEGLVEAFLNHSGFSPTAAFRFLDLGTGSGNIAVTLAKLFPSARAVASDLSEKALAVARRNARRIGVSDRFEFVQADGLTSFPKESFDVIFSNPPYVASRDWSRLDPEVRREPRLALDGGGEGLDFYRKIFKGLSCLKSGGSLWVEIGWDEAEAVRSLFERGVFGETRLFKDLNRIDRIVAGLDLIPNG